MGLVAIKGDVDPADAERCEAVAVVGARVSGQRPRCMQQRSLLWIAGERQGQPAWVRAPQWRARARLGLPRGLAAAGGAGSKAVG